MKRGYTYIVRMRHRERGLGQRLRRRVRLVVVRLARLQQLQDAAHVRRQPALQHGHAPAQLLQPRQHRRH